MTAALAGFQAGARSGKLVTVLRLFRPSILGVVLAGAITIILGFPSVEYRLSKSDDSVQTIRRIGTPLWVEWNDSGEVKVSPLAVPTLVLIWSLPMLLVSAVRRWRYWSEPVSALRIAVYALPILSVAGGMTFSARYWGFAWSLPALDARIAEASWSAIAPFRKEMDRPGWELEPREGLEILLRDPGGDTEAGQEGRIVEELRRNNRLLGLRDLTRGEYEHLRSALLQVAELRGSEKGYDWQRYVRGVFVLGRLEGAGNVAFAAFSGAEESNDHYPTYEVLFALDGGPRLLSQRVYYGDVAGIEGLGAGWASLLLFTLGLLLLPALYVLVAGAASVAEFVKESRRVLGP